jgi:hypothetical protein
MTVELLIADSQAAFGIKPCAPVGQYIVQGQVCAAFHRRH